MKKSLAFLQKRAPGKEGTPAEKKPLSGHGSEDEPPKKKTCVDNDHLGIESILNGERLTDLHVHYAQQILKRQFPHLSGLQPTVLRTKKSLGVRSPLPNQLQVIHCHGDHWILASSIGCRNGDVDVYDSVYRSIDDTTRAVITKLFQASAIRIVESPKQEGGTDCGVFAIANATALAHGINPSSFDQSAMRRHLVKYLKEDLMIMFP